MEPSAPESSSTTDAGYSSITSFIRPSPKGVEKSDTGPKKHTSTLRLSEGGG